MNADGDRWIEIEAEMNVAAAELGLGSLGERLAFALDLYLKGYTPRSAEKTGINAADLDKNPPELPGGAQQLSDAPRRSRLSTAASK